MAIYKFAIHNGSVIPSKKAVIPVFSPGLTGVFGVYESILLRNGHYVAAVEHAQRLLQSAEGAQLASDFSIDKFLTWSLHLAMANGKPNGAVRVLMLDLGNRYADVFLYATPRKRPPASAYKQGVPVILYEGERALPQVKSLNTLVPGLARKAARAAGAHDALLVNRSGCITEGSNCNVFAVQDGVLLAPPAGDVLAGTVMEQVLRLAKKLDIPVQRRALPAADVPQWQEAFLTSTQRGVLPVRSVGDVELGKPGPITQRLHKAYRDWEDRMVGL